MNNKELIEKYELELKDVQLKFGASFKTKVYKELLYDLKQLDEPESIKLRDVLARIKQLDIGTRKVWLDEFLNELGSDYGTLKYKDGYEQGKVEGLIEREKVTIPQFVAGWLNYCKRTGVDLYHAFEMGDLYLGNYAYQKDYSKLKGYFEVEGNQELFARAWLDGYEVEEKKRYLVKMKGMDKDFVVLKLDEIKDSWYLGSDTEYIYTKFKHTRKELEEAGFGEVFDSPLFEVEEVEE